MKAVPEHRCLHGWYLDGTEWARGWRGRPRVGTWWVGELRVDRGGRSCAFPRGRRTSCWNASPQMLSWFPGSRRGAASDTLPSSGVTDLGYDRSQRLPPSASCDALRQFGYQPHSDSAFYPVHLRPPPCERNAATLYLQLISSVVEPVGWGESSGILFYLAANLGHLELGFYFLNSLFGVSYRRSWLWLSQSISTRKRSEPLCPSDTYGVYFLIEA